MKMPSPSHPSTGFVDPYEHLPEGPLPAGTDSLVQTMVKVSSQDRDFINSLHASRPTIRITFAILLHRLCHELRANNITEFDPVAYERAVGGLSITLGSVKPEQYKYHGVETGRLTGGTNIQSLPRDDRRPVVRSSQPDEQPHGQAAAGHDPGRTVGVARSPDSASSVATDAAGPCESPVGQEAKRTTRTRKGHK